MKDTFSGMQQSAISDGPANNNDEMQQNRRRFVSLSSVAAIGLLAGSAIPRQSFGNTTTQPDMTGLVSVKDYGADHTGMRDSTAQIQAAIDNAYPVGNGEAAVFFPSGKYLISDTLRIYNRNNISLIGMRASIFQTGSGKDILELKNTNHCVIKDLYLTCDYSIAANGISLNNAIRTILDNVEIYGVGGHCLWADKSFWLSARDCIFSQPGIGKYAVYHVSDMNNAAYHHCIVSNGSSTNSGGLYHSGGTVLTLIGCDISSNFFGVLFRNGQSLSILNCYFEHNVIGVQWGDNAGNTWPISGVIDNCYFTNRDGAQQPIFIDAQRGTNLRINNSYMLGNSDSPSGQTIGIRINNDCLPQENRQIVIDDTPYTELVNTVVSDPGRRLRRVTTQLF